MPKFLLRCILLAVTALAGLVERAQAIPYFARKYGLTCAACHVQPPKLNEFGERFRAEGYRLPGGAAPGAAPQRTWPLAVWLSGRSDALHDEPAVREAVRAYLNKLELISGGDVGADWLRYFVEWRPVSLETQSRSGEIRLRDRSGRFEDAFVTAAVGRFALTLGQFRQIDQVDVSLRLGLSEPLVLAASLAGSGGGSARERSLRAFSPAGRSPSARLALRQPLGGGWSWTSSAALPVPGEFSLPLTDEARVEASHELEWRRKGVLLESFVRRGLFSVGGHAFYDDAERYLVQSVLTGSKAAFFWTGVGGVERQAGVTRGRWSVETEYVPHYMLALGARLEDRAGDTAGRGLASYLRAHFPGTSYTFYIGLEQRLQRRSDATLLELGVIF